MKSLPKSLVIAVLQMAIVVSLSGKLLYDRTHRPRLWVKAGSVDPDLPIRGRYVTLNLEVHAPEWGATPILKGGQMNYYDWQYVELSVENGRLVAHKTDKHSTLSISNWGRVPSRSGGDIHLLSPSVAFFLPEHAEVPRLTFGDELWAEVTIPKEGPPRPIQLAIKHGTTWTPLTYR